MKKYFIIVILIILISVGTTLGIVSINKAKEEKAFAELFKEHREETIDILDEIAVLEIQDSLKYISTYSIGIPGTGVSQSRYVYHLTWKYAPYFFSDTNLHDIVLDYLDYAEVCGVHEGEYLYCTIDDIDVSYRFDKSQQDTTSIEIYEMHENYKNYQHLEYKVNDYLKIFKGIIDEDGIIDGKIFVYQFTEKIEYYEIRDYEVFHYEIFDIDGFTEFYYYYLYDADKGIYKNVISFYEQQQNVKLEYSIYEDSLEVKGYQMRFMFDDLINDSIHLYGKYFINLKYDENGLLSIYWSEEVEGWAEFYDANCEIPVEPNIGICNSSSRTRISILLNDYQDEDVQDLLNLSLFGLSYTRFTYEDIINAEEYFLANYEDICDEFDFDINNRAISSFPNVQSLFPNTEVIETLLLEK